MGSEVWGSGLWVQGSGFRVQHSVRISFIRRSMLDVSRMAGFSSCQVSFSIKPAVFLAGGGAYMELSSIWHIWGARNQSLLQAKQAEITNTKIQMTSKFQTKRAKFQTRSHGMGSCLGFRMLIIVISLFFGICHLAFPLIWNYTPMFRVQGSAFGTHFFHSMLDVRCSTFSFWQVSFSIKQAVLKAGVGAHISLASGC